MIIKSIYDWSRNKLSYTYKKKINANLLASIFMCLNLNIAIAATDYPKIEIVDGQSILVLPQILEEKIAVDFPKYRIPKSSDITGIWKYKVKKDPTSLPFVAIGDFNGDGLNDLAILLISSTGINNVIYHRNGADYLLARKEEILFSESNGLLGAQQIILSTLKKGDTYSSKSFNNDSVVETEFERSSIIIYWNGGGYEIWGYAD
jgi:hypothetical protein